MSICPFCFAKIDSLINEQSGTMGWNMYLRDGEGEYDRCSNDFEPDGYLTVWKCPECNKTLFISEKDAVRFLKIGNLNIINNILSVDDVQKVNKKLSDSGDWSGTEEEWIEYIKTLIQKDVGNF